MANPTFQPRGRNGKLLPAVEYVPLLFIAGTQTHRLALHRSLNRALPDKHKDWHVSEPTTGMHVRTVVGIYKGVPTGSNGYNQREARLAALGTLEALLVQIGSDKFNDTINKAKEKLA